VTVSAGQRLVEGETVVALPPQAALAGRSDEDN
jgi:hypothetical protein